MQTQVSSAQSSTGEIRVKLAIDAFRAALSKDDQVELDKVSKPSDAQEIWKFTTELDQRNAQSVGRCVSARVYPLLESVQQFSSVADVFANYRPEISALIWGSTRFVLIIATRYTAYFDNMSKLFMEVGAHCPRFSEYQSIFSENKRLQDCLCDFYATLIELCTKAVQVMQRSALEQTLMAVWSSFDGEFGQIKQKLKQQNSNVKDEIRLALVRVVTSEQSAHVKERALSKAFRKETIHYHRQEEQRAKKWETIRSLELRRARIQTLLDKFSSFDYTAGLRKTRSKCLLNTGQWLSKTAAFAAWRAEKRPSVLACYGKLGSGKRLATANAIVYLLNNIGESEKVAYFFCQCDDVESLKATTIISSVIKQLSKAENVTTEVEKILKETVDSRTPSYDQMRRLLQTCINADQKNYIFIVAIDECVHSERKAAFQILEDAMSKSGCRLKLCISAQEAKPFNFGTGTSAYFSVSTQCDEASLDLSSFIDNILALKLYRRELKVGSQELLTKILDALSDGADGMSLWVELMINDLCQCTTDNEIEAVLESLPKGLSEAYDHLLSRIRMGPQLERVQKIFSYVMTARRPLKLEELGEAITIAPRQLSARFGDRIHNLEELTSWCHGLIARDEDDHCLHLVHSSLKAFFLRPAHSTANSTFHVNFDDAEMMLGKICTIYLNFSDFDRTLARTQSQKNYEIAPRDLSRLVLEQNTSQVVIRKLAETIKSKRKSSRGEKTRFELQELLKVVKQDPTASDLTIDSDNYPFLSYASLSWIYHSRNFESRDSWTWEAWSRLLQTNNRVAHTPWTNEEFESGSTKVVEFIKREHHFALLQYLRGKSLPHWNANGRRVADEVLYSIAVQLTKIEDDDDDTFIKISIQMNKILSYTNPALVPWNARFTPYLDPGYCARLRIAIEEGRSETAFKLIDGGKHIDFNLYGDRALFSAVRNSQTSIVKALVQAGANVNAMDHNTGDRVLDVALQNRELGIIEILVAAKIDVPPNKKALHFAVRHGSGLDILRALLVLDRVIDMKDEDGWTPLHVACGQGASGKVKILLDAGAKVDSTDNRGRTPLNIAAENLDRHVIELLVAAGAKLDAEFDDGKASDALVPPSSSSEVVEKYFKELEAKQITLE